MKSSSARRLFVLLSAFAVLLGLANPAQAQLAIKEGIPIDSLIRTHFIGGGAQVTNLTYRGFARGISYFNGTKSNLGIDEGVLLTSGWVGYAVGPNNDEDITFPALQPGDDDLTKLVNHFTLDAVVLEFDFIPFQDTVRFEYVFGSEEYTEYVGSVYNDVFAFFISGPDITGKQNIALIPGTNIPVAINNVNHIDNTQYYVNNYGGQTVQYDGFTTVLEAVSPVTPCETYHLKLAIADVGDNLLDSGVFLKSGSFDAGNQYSVVALRDAAESGCEPGIIEIQRLGNLSDSITVYFSVLGSATAGSDYTAIPSKVTFLSGQGSVRIPIQALQDSIADNGEYVTIYIEDICKTGLVKDSVRIYEVAPFEITGLADTVLCQGENLYMEAVIKGGSGFFDMEWTGGNSTRILQMSPALQGEYVFTVRDSITGCEKRDTVRVLLEEPPFVEAGPDKVICPGGKTQIEAQVSGPNPPYQVVWSPMNGLSNPNVVSPEASPQQTTVYRMTVTSPLGCVREDTVTVFVTDIFLDIGPDTTLCEGGSVAIGGEAAGGVPPYTYQWFPPSAVPNRGAPQNIVSPDTTTTYRLLVRSANGCTVEDSVTVTVSRVLLDAGPDVRLCAGESRVIGDSAWTTHPLMTYRWEPEEGLDNPFSAMPTASPTATTTYIVTAQNAQGCVARDTVEVRVNDLRIDAGGPHTICQGDSAQLSVRVPLGTPPYTYRWSPDVGLSDAAIAGPSASPRVSVWYVCTVVDAAGCLQRDSVLVTVLPNPEPRIDLSGSPVFCTGDSVRLDAGAGFASYRWSTGAQTRRITAGTAGRYWVEVTSFEGCGGVSDTVEVIVSDRPAPRISGPLALCAGDTASFRVPDAPGSVYDWTVSGGSLLSGQGQSGILATWESPGTYTVHIDQVFGSASCRGDTTITVVVHPIPEPVISVIGPLTFCEGDSVRLVVPAGSARYLWSTGDTTREISVRASGSYAVSVTSAAGCTATAPPVEVRVVPLPEPEIIALTPHQVCDGDSVLLGLTEPYAEYRWSDGSRGATLTTRRSGRYSVTVTTADGCAAESAPFDVVVRPLPAPRIVADGPLEFCAGDSVRLRTEFAYARWEWSTGDTARIITVHRSGVYAVKVWTDEGCSGDALPITVTVHAWPAPPDISRAGDTLISTPAPRYQWYQEVNGAPVPLTGETGPFIRSLPDTRYWVRIWSDFGCDTISLPYMWKRQPDPIEPASTVALPVLEANPGDHVTVDFRLTAQQQLSQAGIRTYQARIRYNSSMLVPVGATPEGRIVGNQRVIEVSGVYDSTRDLLARLEFIAALGDAASTPLVIESFSWDRPDVALTRIDGLFQLGICREGGDRLFDATGMLALEPNHPNPFNSMTVLTYEVIERGRTELFILDVLGRRVATLVDGDVAPGRYQVAFDAGDLTSGIYIGVLRTPSQVRMRTMRLLK